MSWIQTFTGRQFFPSAPRPEDVDVADIAHALSLQCRFNGHCAAFYSVAEHCVRVSRLLSELYPGRRDLALWGLLHDAAEAYVADLPRPVKAMMPGFREMEDRVLRVVVARYGLPWPMPAEVCEADDALLVTECRDLMGPCPAPWETDAEPLPTKIEPADPKEAERMFLGRFGELVGHR